MCKCQWKGIENTQMKGHDTESEKLSLNFQSTQVKTQQIIFPRETEVPLIQQCQTFGLMVFAELSFLEELKAQQHQLFFSLRAFSGL